MTTDPTPAEWDTAQRVLRAVLHDPTLADDRTEFRSLVAGVNRAGRKHARQQAVQQTDVPPQQRSLPRCYICKERYALAHSSNPALCPACGTLNAQKRSARADLTGRTAVLTGGRIKIGYAASLKLLRDGARVIVTTRFPQDAAQRYAQEPDVQEWRDRLALYGLDLRDLRSVQAFIEHLQDTEPHLDVLINNAAQTISRPREFYAHLLDGERQALPLQSASLRILQPSALLTDDARSSEALQQYFPEGELDADGQQLDLRPANSWSARLQDVSLRELLEVQLVNSSAPFLLCTGLLPLLRRSPFARRFIVNVSAMEGQFTRRNKTERHPHTNMAKAALNMLTRTSGPDLAKEGIYMTSVDTGWITNENPHPKAARMGDLGFRLPLDLIDGASRIYDPVVVGLTQEQTPPFGVFLKDYRPYPW
ncbi:SDR family oxidoreductase [Deinococcus sp. HMF7604]|uniref:SDR family NAD(P)-dependent oxidoreductase n=1 Tax=Deinococcus betulae TaxID=2873312 RepID=UPI001CCDB5AA|nr:SDR family oxidoreductase [Deinococcus betulae]MBZ9752705.1 SDR family oxidoreductase [Deinococcus betulae]